MIGEQACEPVEAGRVGPQIRPQQRVARPIHELIRNLIVCPERDACSSVPEAGRYRCTVVDSDVELRSDVLHVVVQRHAGPNIGVIGDHE